MNENQKEWYKKWWGVILAILILPFFAAWYIWVKTSWPKAIKVVLTIALGLITFAAAIGSKGATPVADTTTQQIPTKSAPVATPPAESKPEEPKVPAEYKSALAQAGTYANEMHLSKKGVYDQLVSAYGGKFKPEAAQYAVDNVKADWNANALAQARTYQNDLHLSPAGVRDQLVSEYGGKFTASEADYAIAHLND